MNTYQTPTYKTVEFYKEVNGKEQWASETITLGLVLGIGQ